MPTKHKKSLTQKRDKYAATSEHEKCQARTRYADSSDIVTERSSERMKTDKTLRNKNRLRSVTYMKHRLECDEKYREQNRARAAQTKKRRLETDEAYRTQHAARGKSYKKMKLQTDDKYRTAHVQQAVHYRRMKLANDPDYRRDNAQKTKEYRRRRLQDDLNYKYQTCKTPKFAWRQKLLQTNWTNGVHLNAIGRSENKDSTKSTTEPLSVLLERTIPLTCRHIWDSRWGNNESRKGCLTVTIRQLLKNSHHNRGTGGEETAL